MDPSDLAEPAPPRGRPTLADVARAAGLSVPTVSRALRNHPDVSDGARRLTLEAAERTGYRLNSAARALRTGRHEAISFVIPYGLIGWWEPLLQGAGRAAHEAGFRVLLNPVELQSGPDSYSLTTFFERAGELPVDAFVLVTPGSDAWKESQTAALKPVVVIDDTREHPGHHVWSSDNYTGAYEAVEYLVSRGRKSIAALVPEPGFVGRMVDERLAGYRDALAAAGLAVRDDLVWHTQETYPPTLETSDAVDVALAHGVAFDAVFALADYAVFSALRSLRRAGVDVPDDVSIVGFDDDAAAAALDPPLTTMAQPLADLGAGAVRTLIDLINGKDSEPVAHRLRPRLVERRSA
jgi:LacI family transcriptional regulator